MKLLAFGLLALATFSPAWAADDAAPIGNPRELFELLGAPPAALAPPIVKSDFVSGGDDHLWRLLYAVRRFPLAKFDQWKQTVVPVADVLAMPEFYHAQIIAWSGRVERVAKLPLPAKAAESFDLPHYYRCEIAIGPDRAPAVVYCLAVPAAWKVGEPIDQPAAVAGFLVRLSANGDDDDGNKVVRPVLIARRIAWFPPNMLGDLQMDAGLFDELDPRPAMTAEDRECFYQLLAAVGRAGTRQLLRQAPAECPVEPLFNNPHHQHGKLVALTGTARQALPVRVDDADIVARFGIDHYYEIEMFTEDSQGNPLTFCVRELPKGFPEGSNIHEPVRIVGFFLKKWSYRRRSAGADAAQAGRGPTDRQSAPLIIGPGPIWLEPPVADHRFATGIFVALFVVLTVVLWLVVWWWNRTGDRFHTQVVERLATTPDRSLNEIGLEDHGRPDFSHLG